MGLGETAYGKAGDLTTPAGAPTCKPWGNGTKYPKSKKKYRAEKEGIQRLRTLAASQIN